MIYARIPHTLKNVCIDNETDTLSTTRLDGRTVLAMPLFGNRAMYLVVISGEDGNIAHGKADAITAFLKMADAYSDDAYAFISERFI